MTMIDFNSNALWSSSDLGFDTPDMDVGDIGASNAGLQGVTSDLLSAPSLGFGSGVSGTSFDVSSSFLSPGSLGLGSLDALGMPAASSSNYSDFVDYRGPSQITVFNANTTQVGKGIDWLGKGVSTFGEGLSLVPRIGVLGRAIDKAGEGLSFAGNWLTKHPLSATYIKTETMPGAKGFAELRSRYIGVGVGDGLATGGVYGQTSSINGGGFDLDNDGHGDGAYGLVMRANTPLVKLGGEVGKQWSSLPTLAGGGQLINNMYYTPFGQGVSDTLAIGLFGNTPGTGAQPAKPTSFQVGLRWPTDAAEFDTLIDRYDDLSGGYVRPVYDAGISLGNAAHGAADWLGERRDDVMDFLHTPVTDFFK